MNGAGGGSPLDVDLDRMREVGDPLADAAVAAYFADVEHTDPADLFRQLVGHVHLPPEEQVPAVQEFFAAAATPPDWCDPGLVAAGQQFFDRLVAHHFAALYLASLPSSYGAAKGVQVLRMTGRLQTDAQRRLDETAQFLMDVSAPGSLGAGGVGVDRILHVRLMHAAVRWLILHDPSVTIVPDLAPPVDREGAFVWSPAWGVPVNQEDLAGTWLTFTVVVYEAFDASGVDYDDADVAGHLHLWRLIGHHLGVDPELIPADRVTAAALRDRIWQRQQAPSAAGRAMTQALLDQSRERMPRWAYPLMPTSFRHFVGDAMCDRLGIPPANWTRHLYPAMDALTRLATRGKERHPWHARISAFVGRHLMDGMLAAMRHGDRPAFAIPTHLAR